MRKKELYVCGGDYFTNGEWKFYLVRPSGKGALPYITDRKSFNTCRHHSHLYRILVSSEYYLALELVTVGDASLEKIRAPRDVVFEHNNELIKEVYSVIQSGWRHTL